METTFTIFDTEADGLLRDASRVHCLCARAYRRGKPVEKRAATDPAGMRALLAEALSGGGMLVGHNIIGYDIPLLQRLAGVGHVPYHRCVDTLALSWHLFPERRSHGLAAWGADLGVAKPGVADWRNLGAAEYLHRCEQDVEINLLLFRRQFNALRSLYGDGDGMMALVRHLAFKMDCLREQDEEGIALDADRCRRSLARMGGDFGERTGSLSRLMPPELGKVLAARPARPFRKDGSLSATGERWRQRTEAAGLPFGTEEIREAPNPASNAQLKLWLEGLGWRPATHKPSKATGQAVPQVSLPNGGGLCPSVRALFGKEPALAELDGLYTLRHRMGLLKSLLAHMGPDGRVRATAHGLTNTLRLAHAAPIANLPKPDAPLGREVREVLVAPKGDWTLCGADIAALEDSTKQHFIRPHDPQYVDDMQVPGFDPHLDIAVLAGLMTPQECLIYKEWQGREGLSGTEREEMARLRGIRSVAKSANFAATYGAGAAKIAETAKIPLAEAQKLHATYWERNAAVRKVAAECETKRAGGRLWLLNPVSKMWVGIRDDKDRFSALNQSTGAYVFDTWLALARGELNAIGIRVCMQYHDELLLACQNGMREKVRKILEKSMEKAHKALSIRVLMTISVSFGPTYADCH